MRADALGRPEPGPALSEGRSLCPATGEHP